jgi:hypothetical protein
MNSGMSPDPRTPVPAHIHELDTLRALWVPTWYDLDHEIALGWQDSLRFFVTPDPDVLQIAHDAGKRDFDAILFTGLASSGPWFTLFGTVTSIQHAQLGAIQSIFSNGLDYTVVPVEGPPFIVNAEEQPGTVWDAVAEKWIELPVIPHWIMEVTILLDYQTPPHPSQQTTPRSLNLETLIASSRPASTPARPPGAPPSRMAHPSFTLTPDRAPLRGHRIARAALILYFVACLAAGIVTNSSHILFAVMAVCASVSFVTGSRLQRFISAVLLPMAVFLSLADYFQEHRILEIVHQTRELQRQQQHLHEQQAKEPPTQKQ